MCLILFSFQQHPDYPLILVANRDEFYERSTRPAVWWEEAPGLLAGKDLQGGGSWMGIHKNGRWAALTNYRDGFEQIPDAPSRGPLVTNYLNSSIAPNPYMESLKEVGNAYNGYNLLTGNRQELLYYSNRAPGIIQGETRALWP